MSLFADRLAGWPRWQKLCLALGASMVLHLGGLVVLQLTRGEASEVALALGVGSVRTTGSGVRLTLRGPDMQESRQAAFAPAAAEATEATAATEASQSTPVKEVTEVRAASAVLEPATMFSGAGEPLAAERLLAADVPPFPALPVLPKPPPGSRYFRRSELTVGAVPLDEPAIEPPDDSAGDALRGGTVVLRVFLAADGAVDGVEVASSSLPPAFGEAAVAAFSRLRFRPGEIQGVAVSSESRFEVAFDAFDAGGSHASDRGAGRR